MSVFAKKAEIVGVVGWWGVEGRPERKKNRIWDRKSGAVYHGKARTKDYF